MAKASGGNDNWVKKAEKYAGKLDPKKDVVNDRIKKVEPYKGK